MRHAHVLARTLSGVAAAVAVSLVPAAAPAATGPVDEGRNFDARIAYNQALAAVEPGATQQSAVEELKSTLPDLLVTYDDATGVTRSLWNGVGYLTPEAAGEPEDLALDFVRGNLDLLGLTAADLEGYEVTDRVYSRVSDSTHLYLRQVHRGIPVYNGQLQVNVGRGGRLLSVNNAFVPELAAIAGPVRPELSAGEAVAAALAHLGLTPKAAPAALSAPAGPRQSTPLDPRGISTEPIRAELAWLPVRQGEVRLVWSFQLYTLDRQHAYDLTVDAASGQVWTRSDWVAADSYQVYPQPVESPNHTAPLPPADARVVVNNPADPVASPFAWHDTNGFPGPEFTTHRGNNVHAYDDLDANGLPPALEPNCGAAINCLFGINLAGDPLTYTAAAVTNLFYWNNILHDVQYRYGFDEAAGNFQVNNYGHPGLGNDDVRAEAQDGGGINNANFLTPPDGSRPRMQMFLWNRTVPRRDGDLENTIIAHEYGHGISNRLVGGPGNVSCLNNLQQPGEGLSDWWGLAYTATAAQTGATVRGIGTYVLGQPTNGPGIRPQPYSTNPAVNTWTYASVAGMSIPHGVGAVWAQGAWEVYWALVNRYGFSANLANATGGAGNQRAMLYVNEGLKNTICRPAFTDVRDGMIQAAVNLHGGEDVCHLWRAFAAFGLGNNAVSGGPNGLAPVNGFDVPATCKISPVIVRNTVSGTNSPVAQCPPGTKVIGGGCSDDFTSTTLRSGFLITTPPSAFEGYGCVHETNPGSLTVYAICVPATADLGLVRVSTTTGATNSHQAICPAGKKVIGGGCRDDFTSTQLRSSFPTQSPPFVNEGWACIHVSTPGSLTAQAACVDAPELVGIRLVQRTEGFFPPHAICPASTKVVGGGCSDDFTSTTLRSMFPTQSPPFVSEGFFCDHNSNPGSLTAFAFCRAP
jgi:extracellular elastinolytic metalloproteinase